MSGGPFGRGGPGLLQRLRPHRIDVADLREAAEEVFPALAGAGLRIAVLDRPSGGAVVDLEEGERRLRVHLADLAEDMADAGVPPTPAGLRAALRSWVAHRPVTDAAAAEAGVAVLDWTDGARTAVGWRVAVPRGGAALPWTPSPSADVASTRTAAIARACDVGVDLRVEGPVALWSHPSVPLLATAVLAAPERLPVAVAEAGLELPDLHVVVTPHRPVAGAGAGVAARLAGEIGEPRVVLPWRELAGLPWR